MPQNSYYDPTTVLLTSELFGKIKIGLDVYMLKNAEHQKKVKMAKGETYFKLIGQLEKLNPRLVVTPKWLIDLYGGRKTDRNCQKDIITALSTLLEIDNINDTVFTQLILEFKSLCAPGNFADDFAGKYKLFVGGRYQPSMYSIAYDIPIEIYENGVVRINQTYTEKIYWGLLLLKDANTLEIVSFDFVDGKIQGIGSFLIFKINGYRKRQNYFPGLNFSFDSAFKPVVYQALLCTDHAMERTHPIVQDYFSQVVNNLRMECPDLIDTELLREKYSKLSQ